MRLALCGGLVVLGFLVLIGWSLGMETLKSVIPGQSTMKVNTAIGFVLVGFGLAAAGRRESGAAVIAVSCGAAAFLLGLLTMVEYLAHTDIGIDQAFLPDKGTLTGSGFPGRMSPLTATAWMGLGPAILLLSLARKSVWLMVAHLLAAYAGFVAFVASAGYAFGGTTFWLINDYTAIAIHTAIGLLVAVAAALMTHPETGWLRDVSGSPSAWALLSRFLPVAAILPIALGFMLMLGVGVGAYNVEFGFSLFAPMTALALVWVTVRIGREMRDSEFAMREYQEQLAAFISQTMAGFSEVDLNGVFTAVNDRFCEIVGRTREELLRLNLLDITHPDDRPRNKIVFQRAVVEGAPYAHEKRYVRPDGSAVWVNNSVSVSRRANGEPYGVLAVSIDVTERRRAEETLRKNAESVRLAIEGAGMATWELDSSSLSGEWSPNRFDILGFARTPDLRGGFEDWIGRVHPEDVELARGAVDRCLTEGVPFNIEYRIFRADTGEERWLQSHCSRFGNGGEEGARLLGVSFDITERKHAEAALQESEWRFRTIFEQANDYIFTADLDQRVTSCNPAVCAALGYTEEEALGKSFAHFVGADGFEQTTAMLNRKVQRGGSTRHTIAVNTKDGRRLIWEINSRLMTDASGQPTGLHAIARDVTEARQFEEHQRLLIDELNHRVKNTLAIVQAMAQQTFKGDARLRAASEVFQGRLSALSTAHNILVRDRWSPASLTQIVRDVVKPHSGADERVRIEGPDVTIPPKTAITLALAVHELCTNAAKYGALSTPGGEVHIGWDVMRADGQIRLRMKWVERGGPPVTPPARRGFGTRMIERGLAAELGGKAEILFKPEGLECVVDAVLTEGQG